MRVVAVVATKVAVDREMAARVALVAVARVVLVLALPVVQVRPIQAVVLVAVVTAAVQAVKVVTALSYYQCQQAAILVHILVRKCLVTPKRTGQTPYWLGQVQGRTQHEPFCKN
jgi:hypothetical protein